MRARPRYRIVTGAVAALLAVGAVAGPAQAAPTSWLTATPSASPIVLEPGGSVTATITNTDRRITSSALTVALATSPSTAPFALGRDLCTGMTLRPGASCTVEVRYDGPKPTTDHTAALTISSGKPAKASITRRLEVGVTFADVCGARDGTAGYGGTVTVLGAAFAVGHRCDWDAVLATPVYNAAHEALGPECFDLGYSGTLGYPVTAETGRTAVACVLD